VQAVPSTITVNYIGPQPIVQGATAYAAGQTFAAGQAYGFNAQVALNQAMRLVEGAQRLADNGLQDVLATIRVGASNDSRAQSLALAVQLLDKANALAGEPSATITMQMGADGRWNVRQSARLTPGQRVVQSRCVACHERERKRDLLTPMTPQEAWSVFVQLSSDDMPKGGPALSREEKGHVLDWVKTRVTTGQASTGLGSALASPPESAADIVPPTPTEGNEL